MLRILAAITGPFDAGQLSGAGAAAYGGTAPTTTIVDLIKNIGNAMFSVLGLIFLFLTFYAGFLWMTAMGDSKKVAKAKDIFAQAITGLVIVIVSYGITWFVMTWALVLAI